MKVPDHVLRNRRNKTARGMTITAYRSNHSDRMSSDALSLSVHGTLDRLAHMKWTVKRRTITVLSLSEHGKQKLARLRAMRNREI